MSTKNNMRYTILTPAEGHDDCANQFAADVLAGLSDESKYLSSKYFYDEVGEQLFREITQLDEYYLTRCENEILETHGRDIARTVGGESFNLVELGPGDGTKTHILLKQLQDVGSELRYVPIDICESSIKQLIQSMSDFSPELMVEGLVAEYTDGVEWLANQGHQRNFVIFLGSNIGNFDRSGVRRFLHRLWNALNDGDFILTGFDLKKDLQTMNDAYNDSRNVTAEFNLNLLKRINRELGGDFDTNQFEFRSGYDASSGAVESYLVSRKKQEVHVEALDRTFSFEAGETIHTEYSHKFSPSEVEQMANETGFEVVRQFTDSRGYFVDSLWTAKKS